MKYEELNDFEIVSYISENIEEAKEDDKAKAEEENKKKEAAKKTVEGSKKGKAKPTSKGKK